LLRNDERRGAAPNPDLPIGCLGGTALNDDVQVPPARRALTGSEDNGPPRRGLLGEAAQTCRYAVEVRLGWLSERAEGIPQLRSHGRPLPAPGRRINVAGVGLSWKVEDGGKCLAYLGEGGCANVAAGGDDPAGRDRTKVLALSRRGRREAVGLIKFDDDLRMESSGRRREGIAWTTDGPAFRMR